MTRRSAQQHSAAPGVSNSSNGGDSFRFPFSHRPASSRASVLVGLLWCVALLAVIVIGTLHTSRLDLRVAKNHGDLIQAHYLALAGVEKAKALLYHDARDRRAAGKNHTGQLRDAPQHFRDVPLGRGQFRVYHQGRPEESGRILFGVTDEESRLNVNHASAEELGKLRGMTPEMAACILDYRDPDDVASPGGAEAELYSSLQPAMLPRNGPFRTLRELGMVFGISRELFAGEDVNLNGFLDPEENDGDVSFPPDNRDNVLDAGWSGLLTVDSRVGNQNAAGKDRVNIQSADEAALAAVPGISADLARAIVAYRNQNRLESLADLLDVTAVREDRNRTRSPSTPAAQPSTPDAPASTPFPAEGAGLQETAAQSARSGQRSADSPASNANTGEKLIRESLLLEIADDLSATSDTYQPGAVNINSAPRDVLVCLPGITPEIAQAIISYRESSGYFPNTAYLLNVPGITRDIFKQVLPRVTARSETFRIISEGKIGSTGARKRLQVIVRIGSYSVETLSFREDL